MPKTISLEPHYPSLHTHAVADLESQLAEADATESGEPVRRALKTAGRAFLTCYDAAGKFDQAAFVKLRDLLCDL